MRHPIRVHLAALLLACSACGRPPSPQDAPAPPTAEPAWAPIAPPVSLHRLRIGERLVLRFDASPASGYAWTFAGPLPPILRMERDPAQRPPERPRDATVQAWTFRAERTGHAKLSFVYGRPWEARSVAPVHRVFDVWVE